MVEVEVGVGVVVVVEVVVSDTGRIYEIQESLDNLARRMEDLGRRVSRLETIQARTDVALYRARKTLALLLIGERGVKREPGKKGSDTADPGEDT